MKLKTQINNKILKNNVQNNGFNNNNIEYRNIRNPYKSKKISKDNRNLASEQLRKKYKPYRIKGNEVYLIVNAPLAIEKESLREPENYKDIFSMTDKAEWLKAVDEELNNMKIYECIYIYIYIYIQLLIKYRNNANVISTKWVLKYKKNSECVITKRKAILIAKGYAQVYGIDYTNTFSPTLKQDSLRIIEAIAIQNKFSIHQMNIKTAYLNAKLDVEVYMKLPEGYCKLNKIPENKRN